MARVKYHFSYFIYGLYSVSLFLTIEQFDKVGALASLFRFIAWNVVGVYAFISNRKLVESEEKRIKYLSIVKNLELERDSLKKLIELDK